MKARRGLTMLEMIVGLVIVGLLAGIGSLTFSLLSAGAQDREARQRLDRVVLAERSWAAKNVSWTADASELTLGRGIDVVSGVSRNSAEISLSVEDGVHLGLAALSEAGNCQAKYVGDPLLGTEETWVTIPEGQPCSGRSAILYGR